MSNTERADTTTAYMRFQDAAGRSTKARLALHDAQERLREATRAVIDAADLLEIEQDEYDEARWQYSQSRRS